MFNIWESYYKTRMLAAERNWWRRITAIKPVLR